MASPKADECTYEYLSSSVDFQQHWKLACTNMSVSKDGFIAGNNKGI